MLNVACAVLAVFGLSLAGCKKADPMPQGDPFSSNIVARKIAEEGALLNDSVKQRDFASIDKQAYYLQGMIKALSSKLDAEQKQRTASFFDEMIKVAEELDHAAGRRHEEATVASNEKLQGMLKELEKQFQGTKQGG